MRMMQKTLMRSEDSVFSFLIFPLSKMSDIQYTLRDLCGSLCALCSKKIQGHEEHKVLHEEHKEKLVLYLYIRPRCQASVNIPGFAESQVVYLYQFLSAVSVTAAC